MWYLVFIWRNIRYHFFTYTEWFFSIMHHLQISRADRNASPHPVACLCCCRSALAQPKSSVDSCQSNSQCRGCRASTLCWKAAYSYELKATAAARILLIYILSHMPNRYGQSSWKVAAVSTETCISGYFTVKQGEPLCNTRGCTANSASQEAEVMLPLIDEEDGPDADEAWFKVATADTNCIYQVHYLVVQGKIGIE